MRKRTLKKLTSVDLFCGAGGFTEGFKRAGFKTIFATDFDEMAVKTFKFNHTTVPTAVADITTVNKGFIINTCESSKINVDAVIGGPPCQGFSIAGQRIPEDPKNKLVLEYIRIVSELNPAGFVFENVPGIISMQDGAVLRALEFEFERLGYSVKSKILNPVDYGVPQSRPRFFMVGLLGKDHRVKTPSFNFPNPTHCKSNDDQLTLFNNIQLEPYVTVDEALSDLIMLEAGSGLEETNHKSRYLSDYQTQRKGRRRPGKLFNHRATNHSDKIKKRYSLIPQGGTNRDIPKKYRTKKINVFKLHPELPSNTVTCNFRTDLLNPWGPRGLTVREAARLQSFDDDYCFFGNLTRKAKFVTQDDQVGNAVPPILAKAIAKELSKYITNG